jgi:hypothetical protein
LVDIGHHEGREKGKGRGQAQNQRKGVYDAVKMGAGSVLGGQDGGKRKSNLSARR